VSIELRRVRVCSVDDVPAGEGRVVRIGDRPIAVFHVAETFHALDNTCTHMGGPLADGLVADETVACPLHERRFGLATGQAVGHDCGAVAAYPTEVEGGGVYVTIPVVSGPKTNGVTIGTFTGDEVKAALGDAGQDSGA
jgi:nitrite reductase (NADH) small subunit